MPGSVEAAQAGAQGPSTAPTAPAPGAMGLPLPAAADTKEAEAALHGVHIGSTEDLVADVQLPDPHQVSTPAAGSACSAERQTKAAGDSKAVQPQPQQVEPAPPITPEQEAAVAACCEQFVALYEQVGVCCWQQPHCVLHRARDAPRPGCHTTSIHPRCRRSSAGLCSWWRTSVGRKACQRRPSLRRCGPGGCTWHSCRRAQLRCSMAWLSAPATTAGG
jgi:hypothetical protein